MARAPKLSTEELMLVEMRLQTKYQQLAATAAYGQLLQSSPHGQHQQELISLKAYLQHELVPEAYHDPLID